MVVLKLLVRENRNILSVSGIIYTVKSDQQMEEALGHDIKLLEELIMNQDTMASELVAIGENLELNGETMVNFNEVNFGGVITCNFRNLASNIDYLHITNVGNNHMELIITLASGMKITKLGLGRQIGYFTH